MKAMDNRELVRNWGHNCTIMEVHTYSSMCCRNTSNSDHMCDAFLYRNIPRRRHLAHTLRADSRDNRGKPHSSNKRGDTGHSVQFDCRRCGNTFSSSPLRSDSTTAGHNRERSSCSRDDCRTSIWLRSASSRALSCSTRYLAEKASPHTTYGTTLV